MIAVRAGRDTNHIVNADILRRLGSDGYVVNISRGSVIDQEALVAALSDQTIAGAGLDVFAKEPHAPDALTALPNVVLTPHIGGHTLESHVAMQDCVIANLRRSLPASRCLMRSRTILSGPIPADSRRFRKIWRTGLNFALGKPGETR